MKHVIVYPGRFQPMLSHHAEVYRQLQARFSDADVYFATSDKVDPPKSPFNFKEKQQIAKAHGIDPSKILSVTGPYNAQSYDFDLEDTVLIFAVGEKDMNRFPFDNVDPQTGLQMTKRGDPQPAYIQSYDNQTDHLPMSKHAYVTLAPTIKTGDEVASASAFRKQLTDAPTEASAKEIFTKQFGEYNEQVFQLIYDKIVRNNMSEQINILRKLSGLPVMEAPVNMRPAHGDDDATKLLVGVGHLLQREANNRPMGKGTPDSELEFQNKMSEIGGSMVAGKYATMKDLADAVKSAGDAEQVSELKELLLKLMQDYKDGDRAIGLKPGEKPEMDDEPSEFDTEESVDLSDIRNEYGVEEEEAVQEERGVIGAEDGGLSISFGDYSNRIQLGKTPEEVAKNLKDLGDKFDPQDLYGSSTMDFADEEGFDSAGGANELLDAALDILFRIKEEAVEEAKCGCCGNDPCDCPPDCEGCKSMNEDSNDINREEAVESTTHNAIEAALVELRKLAGV